MTEEEFYAEEVIKHFLPKGVDIKDVERFKFIENKEK